MSLDRTKIIAGIALLTAVSTGAVALHFRTEAVTAQDALAKLTETPAEAAPAEPDVSADELAAAKAAADALRAELEALRNRLAEQEADLAAAQQPVEVVAEAEPAAPPTPGFQGDWLERLKESDPERYKQIQERMNGMQKRVTDAVARQAAFNLNIDPSTMTPEQLANHEALLAKLESMMDLSDQFSKREEGLNMAEVGMQMRDTFQDLNSLYENQRDMLLQNLGKEVGYKGKEAEEFSGYVREIYDMTSPRSLFRGMMPMGGGFGGRGGGQQ